MDAVNRKTARYIQKSLRVRAKMIARTEIIGSLALGQQVAWGQAQKAGMIGSDAKKRWITTGFGACPICTQLSGEEVPISGSFQSIVGPLDRPTAHPNCRCAVVPVPGLGVPGATGVTPTPTTVAPKPKPKPKAVAKRPLTGPEIRKKLLGVFNKKMQAGKTPPPRVAERLVRQTRNIVQRRMKGKKPQAEIDEAIEKYDEAKMVLDKALKKTGDVRQAAHDMLLTDTRSEFKVYNHQGEVMSSKNIHTTARDLNKGIQTNSPRHIARVGERDAQGIEFTRRLLGDKIGKKWNVSVNNSGTGLFEGRSNYTPWTGQGGTINMSVHGGEYGMKTVVHEFAHWIEQRTGWNKESWKWVQRRAKGEQLKQLKKLYPNRKFADDEWAFENKFLDAYIGKKYNNASEVLSMGLEYFYKDPLKFATQDPDMFDFIVHSINEIRRLHSI